MTDYLNNSNKTTFLFKKFQNKAQAGIDFTTNETGGTSFLREQKESLNNIYNTDIFIENIEKNLLDEYKLASLDACGNIPGSLWKASISDQDYLNSSLRIPDTNLIFYKEIYLNPVSATNNAWWFIPSDISDKITDNNLLKDMIPFNFNSISLSTFSPIVKYWNGTQWRTQSQNNTSGLNWLIDYASGILQFYQNDSILNSLNIDCNSSDEKKRPRISFIKYVGKKGLENFSGTTYTADTGVTINGSNEIINTAPDQIVTLAQGGATTITGTYPDFTITSTDTNTTYSAGTGVTINGSNQINIGQPVATTNSVTFAGLDVTETTILRGQTTIDNVLFDERTDSVISGTTYNIHSNVDNTKNLLLGFQDTTGLKKYWKTISGYAREQIDLVTYNESFGLPTSATLIRISNTGTAANDVINYVAQGNHNFYDNDSSKNGIINTARINIKDYAVDNTEYCSIRTSKVGSNGGDLEFYVKDNNGSLEKRMNIKKSETEITNNTGKLTLSSANYSATTGPRIKFSMLDPNVPADNQSVRIRHNIFDSSSPSGSGTPFGLIIEKDGSNTQPGDAYLEVEGRIYSGGIIGHHGVSLNETTVTTSTTQITSHDIDKVIVVVGAVNFSSGWVTFLSYNNFAVGGSYIIHIYSNDDNNSPAHYYYNYTGVMSWTGFPNTNDSNSSQEIPLHGYGRAVEGVGPSIKLRTLSRYGNLTPELQIADATGVNADASFNFTFKMRRML